MDVGMPGRNHGDGASERSGLAPVPPLPGLSNEAMSNEGVPKHASGTCAPAADTALLDLLPHPAFAIAVDGDDEFRFIYTNDAYRSLRGDDVDTELGHTSRDLRQVVPANALVAHVRAFARTADTSSRRGSSVT